MDFKADLKFIKDNGIKKGYWYKRGGSKKIIIMVVVYKGETFKAKYKYNGNKPGKRITESIEQQASEFNSFVNLQNAMAGIGARI